MKLKRAHKIKQAPYKGYTNCEIPAKLFFKATSTRDFTLIGTGTPKEQEDAYYAIFDEFVTINPQAELEQLYKKGAKIRKLQLQISFIEACLHQIVFVPMTVAERLEVIEVLNSLDGLRVKFNTDLPIKEEIRRVQSQIIGSLKTEIKIEQSTEKKQQDGASHQFEQELATICINLGIYLHSEISLYEYVAYRKLAIERSKPKPTK